MVNEVTNDGMKLMPPAPMPDYKKVIRTRVIEFNKEFSREFIVDVCKCLDKLMEYDKIMETPKEGLTIKFQIYSYGGAVDSLMFLLSKIDKMIELGYEVITHNASVAMSCGFILSIYGTVRTCTKHATYLNHQLSAGTWGTFGGMEVDQQHFKAVEEHLEQIIRDHTHMTEEELKRPYTTNRDVFYYACDAIKWGIADIIVTD